MTSDQVVLISMIVQLMEGGDDFRSNSVQGFTFFVPYIHSGGFKYFLFSPFPGEMMIFDQYFSIGLKPPTSISIIPYYGRHLVRSKTQILVVCRCPLRFCLSLVILNSMETPPVNPFVCIVPGLPVTDPWDERYNLPTT